MSKSAIFDADWLHVRAHMVLAGVYVAYLFLLSPQHEFPRARGCEPTEAYISCGHDTYRVTEV